MLIVTTVTMITMKSDDKSNFRSIESNPIFLIFESSPSYFYYHSHHYITIIITIPTIMIMISINIYNVYASVYIHVFTAIKRKTKIVHT